MAYKPIPAVATLQVFRDVFAEYAALLESSTGLSIEATHFMLDVEAQIRQLYRTEETFRRVHQLLLDDPDSRCLRATRSAIGELCLLNKLWPVKSYFSNGK